MSWVATHQDLALSGLAPAACVPDARDVVAIDIATGTFEVDGHGFNGGEPVRFVAPPGNVLPTGLNPLAYYAVAPPPNPDFFQLNPLLLPGDAGSWSPGVITLRIVENVYPKIDAIMAQWTSMLVASAKAYKGPWISPPPWAPLMVALLAAPTVASRFRVPESRYNVALVERQFAWAEERRKDLDSGQPWNDGVGPIDATSTPGNSDAMRGQSRRSAGWECRRYL